MSTARGGVMVVPSQIVGETWRVTWNIADFVKVKDSEQLVQETRVTFDMNRKIGGLTTAVRFEAYLRLQEGQEDQKWIGCYCRAVGVPKYGSTLMTKVSIQIGNYLQKQTVKGCYMVHAWGWAHVIPQNEDVSKLPLDVNGALPIEIEMTLYNSEEASVTVADLLAKFQGIFSHKFSGNMEMVYKDPTAFITSGTPAIVAVVSKDGRRFSAIAAHLAAPSPVFRLMFQTPMTEVKEGVVKMEDIGGEALEVFLHFLHTATLKNNWKEPAVLEELTYAAHKYLMNDLLDFLDESIGLVCTPANRLSMIRLAHQLELNKAKEALLKMYQDQWKQATGVEEMMQLLQE